MMATDYGPVERLLLGKRRDLEDNLAYAMNNRDALVNELTCIDTRIAQAESDLATITRHLSHLGVDVAS